MKDEGRNIEKPKNKSPIYQINLTSDSKTEFKASDLKTIDAERRLETETVEEEKYQTFRYSDSLDENSYEEFSDQEENKYDEDERKSFKDENPDVVLQSEICGKLLEKFPEDFKIDSDEEKSPPANSLFQSPVRKRNKLISKNEEKSKIYLKSSIEDFNTYEIINEKLQCNIQSFDKKFDDTEYTQNKTRRGESGNVSPLKFSEEFINFEKYYKERKTEIDVDNPFKIAADRSNSADIMKNSIMKLSQSEGRNVKFYNSRIMKCYSADLILCWRDDSLNSINIFEG